MVLITGFIAMLTAFKWAFIALLAGFTVNYFYGLLADAQDPEKESFNFKKAIEGVRLLCFYAIILICLYLMTYEQPTMADTAIRWVTYIVSYFYLTNILRNAMEVHPSSQAVRFMYQFLSTEIFFKLKQYLGIKRNINENEPDGN